MVCRNCGKMMSDDALFCDSCGKKLSDENQRMSLGDFDGTKCDGPQKEFEKLPMLSFGQSIANCFSNYANFSGRARRSEYWFFSLFVSLIFFLGSNIIGFLCKVKLVLLVFWIVFFLVLFIPSWAVMVRRLHDTNKSGWFALLNFVPFGSIFLLIFTCFDSQKEENEYGKSPKYVVK